MLIKSLFIFLTISPWPILGDSSIRDVFFGTRRALFRSKSCFCFQKPLSHIDINEVIDPNGNGLERLVVYFYKDIKTNELKIYTPNVEKQRLIPNLAYEGGDYLNNVTSQELFDFFNTNVNVVDVSSVYDKNSDISISKEPLGYNIGEIEENPANIEYPDNSESYSTDVDYVQAQHLPPIKLPDEPLLTTTESINTYPDHVNSNVSTTSQPSSHETEQKLENIKNFPVTEQVYTTYFNSDRSQSSQSPLYPHMADSALIPSVYLEIGNENSEKPDTVNLTINQSLLNSIEDTRPTLLDHLEANKPLTTSSQSYLEIDGKNTVNTDLKDNNNTSNWVSDKAVSFNQVNDNAELSMTTSNNVYSEHKTDSVYPVTSGISPNFFYSSYPLLDYQYLGLPIQSKPQLIYPYKGNYFDVFENWFKDQMEGFRETQSQAADNNLNDDFVRKLVQEILLQNDIFVTNDGMVTKDGVKLNINNLCLRPIMIGDSVGYDKLLQSGDKSNVVSKSTYLKAVLVSLVNPPKILGVIPLGKTRLPNKNSQPTTGLENAVLSNEHPGFYVYDYAGLESEGKPEPINQALPTQIYNGHKFPSRKKVPNDTVKNVCDYKNRNCKSEQKRPIVNIGKRIIPGRPKIEHEYAPHRISYKRRKGLTRKHVKSNDKLTEENSRKANKEGNEVTEKTRRYPIARLLSKVFALLSPDVTNELETSQTNKTEDKAMSRLLDDYEEESEEEKEIEDEKDSMYRIIGGTPATGTGAPLNVRGRRFSDK
ncbi:hypothetical protein K1T71_011770 [Dendrolimus kikuchii]|uniref:Uncharacterized protein n=1 Tax=Dendrolimus kikuchii TaxID=765133 RepID=A0ACC1CM68_9NEOP|nr:hypothetical protein K1T71_011770 [Dendrolimus kikuchii]